MESQICRNSSNPLSAAPLNFSKNDLKSGEEKQNIFTLESFFFGLFYTTWWTLRTLWLVVNYDLLELTNRLHVAVLLFRNRSQMTSKCDTKRGTRAEGGFVTDVLPHFDVFCYQLLKQTQCNKESIRFIQWTEKKFHKVLTCFAPLDCSKNCASLGIFQVT